MELETTTMTKLETMRFPIIYYYILQSAIVLSYCPAYFVL